jgi:hypothetical protein
MTKVLLVFAAVAALGGALVFALPEYLGMNDPKPAKRQQSQSALVSPAKPAKGGCCSSSGGCCCASKGKTCGCSSDKSSPDKSSDNNLMAARAVGLVGSAHAYGPLTIPMVLDKDIKSSTAAKAVGLVGSAQAYGSLAFSALLGSATSQP